ncbi:hypothetical protein Trihar35433_1738 [Trichoderma harzianum]|nr:hypothetical protein Trihar35433_1738 [Trichoderma harzianum]
MNMLRHIAQNNGVVTDGNLRMIQELVDFLLQNSINTFQTEFRKLVAEATPSNDFHNPFLLEQETAQQPVQRILFPSTPLPRKRSRLIDELEAEEDSDLDIGRATPKPMALLGISPTVVCIDLSVPCITGAGAEPELAATNITRDIPVIPVDR